VEKPLAPTSSEAAELVEAARRHRVVLQVGHVERFNPAWTAALPYLAKPKYVEAVRAGGFSFRSLDIGVVLDLMIHDIDLLLSIVQSPVTHVAALGIALFGQHEDIANARLTFANGCVATLSASRVSHVPRRTMQVWSCRAMANLDFNARTVAVVQPSDTVLQQQLDVAHLSGAEQSQLKDRLLAEHLPMKQIEAVPCDAIRAELIDFADSIRSSRAPRVSGVHAQSAVEVAEQIIDGIAAHAWDGVADGPLGPLAAPAVPQIIPAPHWLTRPAGVKRREAG
jgi:predicted dehydrogenase